MARKRVVTAGVTCVIVLFAGFFPREYSGLVAVVIAIPISIVLLRKGYFD